MQTNIHSQQGSVALVMSAMFAIVLGTGIVLFARQLLGLDTSQPSTQAPTTYNSPTPIKSQSQVATQSAFLSLEKESKDLLKQVMALELNDPILSIPTLDLTITIGQ